MNRKEVTILVAVLALVCSLLGLSVPEAAADDTTTAWSRNSDSVQNESAVRAPLTSPGNVMLSGCILNGTDNVAAVQYSADGKQLSTLTQVGRDDCIVGQQVADKSGNVYIDDARYGSRSGTAPALHAYSKTGVKLWDSSSLPLLCNGDDATRRFTQLVMGADDNIYGIAFSNTCQPRAYNLVSFDAHTGALRFSVPLHMQSLDSVYLMAYRNGLIVRTSYGLFYYDHSGKELAGQSISLPNSQNDLIVPSAGFYATSGTSNTVDGRVLALEADNSQQDCNWIRLKSLNAYDTSGLTWKTALSNQCVNTVKVAAMPDGGAIVMLQLSDSNSSTGQQTAQLMRFDARGTQVWFTVLPNFGGDALLGYMDELKAVDVSGNIVVERAYIRGLNNDYNNYQYVVLNGATGVVKQTADTADLGDDLSYTPNYASMGIGDGHVYANLMVCNDRINGQCPEQMRTYAFNVPGLGLDYPRGALNSIDPKPTTQIFEALGDSYISGEGDRNSGFNGDKCHRSTSAWPIRAANDTSLGLTLTAFPACSGAKTHDVLYGGTGQPKQISQLKSGADKVAVSIGGNDAGFSNLIFSCILVDCKNLQQQTLDKIGKLGNVTVLPAVYKAIRQKVGGKAEIYVMGYPYVLPSTRCSVASLGVNTLATLILGGGTGATIAKTFLKGANISWQDFIKAYNARKLTFSTSEVAVAKLISDKLNAKIAAVVKAQNDPKLHFVTPNYTGSPFSGHTLCSSKSYFNGMTLDVKHPSALLGDLMMSFHPNHFGTAAYEQVFARYLKNN